MLYFFLRLLGFRNPFSWRNRRWKRRRSQPRQWTEKRASADYQTPFNESTTQPTLGQLYGPAYIVDGDTLVIKKTQIRLYGVDAPEIDHPYGQKAKWALVRLCKGYNVQAHILAEDDYGRTVARCVLPDGRDLSAEMVKIGLAIDWPKFSGGEYKDLEPPQIRKRLWLADARQKGRMHVWRQFEANQRNRNLKG